MLLRRRGIVVEVVVLAEMAALAFLCMLMVVVVVVVFVVVVVVVSVQLLFSSSHITAKIYNEVHDVKMRERCRIHNTPNKFIIHSSV